MTFAHVPTPPSQCSYMFPHPIGTRFAHSSHILRTPPALCRAARGTPMRAVLGAMWIAQHQVTP